MFGTAAVVEFLEVCLVDHAHNYALSFEEVVDLPTCTGDVHLNTLQEVYIPEIASWADWLLTVSIGVVENGSLGWTCATVVGSNVGGLIVAHIEAKLNGEVVGLPGCAVSLERSASQQVGIPL